MAVSSALEGYTRAENLVNQGAAGTAGQVINSARGGNTPVPVRQDSADLSTEALNLIEGRNAAAANLKTIEVADRMQKSVFEILGY